MKNLIILVFIILLIGCNQDNSSIPNNPSSNDIKQIKKPLGISFVEKAETYLYVRETDGPNRSPEIDKFHDYAGLPYGNPWCLMFVNYVQKEVLAPLDPYTRTARVSKLYQYALSHKYQYKIKTANSLIYGTSIVEPGDIIIFIKGINNTPQDNFNGHTGFVIEQTSLTELKTIEGNTGPGSKGSQRDGDGVYERKRIIKLNTNFRIDALLQPLYGNDNE